MEHTTAEGQVTGNPAKAVCVNGTYLNVDEIAFAYNAPSALGGPSDGCQVEFKRKGNRFIPGLTAEGLFSLVNGAPY